MHLFGSSILRLVLISLSLILKKYIKVKKELALKFIDRISDSYKSGDLSINLEISPKQHCVVFLRVNTPYRIPLSLIACVQELLSFEDDFAMLSLSVVRFNDEQNIMVHVKDLFSERV